MANQCCLTRWGFPVWLWLMVIKHPNTYTWVTQGGFFLLFVTNLIACKVCWKYLKHSDRHTRWISMGLAQWNCQVIFLHGWPPRPGDLMQFNLLLMEMPFQHGDVESNAKTLKLYVKTQMKSSSFFVDLLI